MKIYEIGEIDLIANKTTHQLPEHVASMLNYTVSSLNTNTEAIKTLNRELSNEAKAALKGLSPEILNELATFVQNSNHMQEIDAKLNEYITNYLTVYVRDMNIEVSIIMGYDVSSSSIVLSD